MGLIIGKATLGEAKVWCGDRVFSLIQKGENLTYEGYYVFEEVRYTKDKRGNFIRILRPLFCQDKFEKYADYFENLVYNRRIEVDYRFYRFVNAIRTGKVTLATISKEEASVAYNKMCSVTSSMSEEEVGIIFGDDTFKRIAKEMYDIVISCNREKTNFLVGLLETKQDTSNLNFEAISFGGCKSLEAQKAGRHTVLVVFSNEESEQMGILKATGTYKDRCLNYKAIKRKNSSYISFEEIYPYKGKKAIIVF